MPRKQRRKTRHARVLNNKTKAWMALIGQTIREEREKKPWNQDGLAKAAKLSRKTVSDLENASRSYGIDSLLESMLALDLDPWTFFGGSIRHRPKQTIEDKILHDQLDRILSLASDRNELRTMISELLRRLCSTIPAE